MSNNEDFQEIVSSKKTPELLTMVYQFTEWSPGMLLAVEKELSKRGQLPDDVAVQRQSLIEAEKAILEKGKEASTVGIILGWIGVFGVVGLYMGYTYRYSKTASKFTKERYYTYDEHSRRQGNYLMIYNCAAILFFIAYKIVKKYPV